MTAVPDIAAAAEAGLQDYESSAWLALLASANTKKAVIDKLYVAIWKRPAIRRCALFDEQAPSRSSLPRKAERILWRRRLLNGRRSSGRSASIRCDGCMKLRRNSQKPRFSHGKIHGAVRHHRKQAGRQRPIAVVQGRDWTHLGLQMVECGRM